MTAIDHIGISVSDYASALRFYEAALAPLGISLIKEVSAEQTGNDRAAGLGRDGKPSFWIGGHAATRPGAHIAFAADDRAMVDSFYQAALAAGATDNGPPGLRPHYHPDYYGAFVRDPDGHNIEAVCHKPQ